jgi:hypothetical protein
LNSVANVKDPFKRVSPDELVTWALDELAKTPPPGVDAAYVESFRARTYDELVDAVRPIFLAAHVRYLGTRDLLRDTELRREKERTEANLAALRLVARGGDPTRLTAAQRKQLADYSGWGGLSIRAVRKQYPEGLPVPDPEALIHEYYTPGRLCRAVADLVLPMLPRRGVVRSMEPSAGIGRFIHGFSGPDFRRLTWDACEMSPLSARILGYLRPDVRVHVGTFESWLKRSLAERARSFDLVATNPPYGERGTSRFDDLAFKGQAAYHYFMQRTLDLLKPSTGVAVWLVPYGFMSGNALREERETVLRRAHLLWAFRLPSELFPGANIVTDLIVVQDRGGQLEAIEPSDEYIAAGRYFENHPRAVLGKVIDKGGRWGFEIEGTFEGFPKVEPRPLCATCTLHPVEASITEVRELKGRIGRKDAEEDSGLQGAPEEVRAALGLGRWLDRFLTDVAKGGDAGEAARGAHRELVAVLDSWVKEHGNPHQHKELVKHHKVPGVASFLAAFDRKGKLVDAIAKPPTVAASYRGNHGDFAGHATYLRRRARGVLLWSELASWEADTWQAAPAEVYAGLMAAGWCFDGAGLAEVVPPEDYLTGQLWSRVDAIDRALAAQGVAVPWAQAAATAVGSPVAGVVRRRLEEQRRRLMEAVKPAVFNDIDVELRNAWIPVQLLQGFVNAYFLGGSRWSRGADPVELERRDGLVQIVGRPYEQLWEVEELREVVRVLGYLNHDRSFFVPPAEAKKTKKGGEELLLDEARLKIAKEWNAKWKGWLSADPERMEAVTQAYNRHFRGWRPPTYTNDPVPVHRWESPIQLHPYQNAGCRFLMENNGGILAFDVGLGKTFTMIRTLAALRQEGRAQRPVIIVPNTLVWKWYEDIRGVLPSYRVAVIGQVRHKKKTGEVVSKPDTATDRIAKWNAYRAGQYDVVILPYSMFDTTNVSLDALQAFVDSQVAIQRQIRLSQRNLRWRRDGGKLGNGSGTDLTERQEAVLTSGSRAWLEELLARDGGYDGGPTWEDLQIDCVLVDEGQNFKNLFGPEPREGGVPKYMGSAGGDETKMAWQLYLRCALVRQAGGTVIMGSATPAKNSPLEFYSMMQYVRPEVLENAGILDPEQFIDRYVTLELRLVLGADLTPKARSAAVGFKNLHEIRDMLARTMLFKTAEDVGLKIPEVVSHFHEFDMDAAQERRYGALAEEVEASLSSRDEGARSRALGLLARMALVAVHPELDSRPVDPKTGKQIERWNTRNAVLRQDPHTPRFDAIAANVAKNKGCGHIIFLESVAGHQWLKEVLVESGVAADRIAILNAEVTQSPEERRRVGLAFNGDRSTGTPPAYDVVIANSVAYEGIDLQTRTCAIHHADLPFEPATVQQRNGRGVRQGNTLQTVAIYYYFALRSADGLRFQLIRGKRGWMTSLLASTDRETNNPGAALDLSDDDIVMLVSRDPERTRGLFEERKRKAEEERRAKLRHEAGRLLRSINDRFRTAERNAARDPSQAQALRGEAEDLLRELGTFDPAVWPWAQVAGVVRQRHVVVPEEGFPVLYEGLRFAVERFGQTTHIHVGRVGLGEAGTRLAGQPRWTITKFSELFQAFTEPRQVDPPTWAEDQAQLAQLARAYLERKLSSHGDSWKEVEWRMADPEWVEAIWPEVSTVVVQRLAAVEAYWRKDQLVPLSTADGVPFIGSGSDLVRSGHLVIPPTPKGMQALLSLVRRHDRPTFTEWQKAVEWWWQGRASMPRGYVGADLEAAAAAKGG